MEKQLLILIPDLGTSLKKTSYFHLKMSSLKKEKLKIFRNKIKK